MANGCYAIAEYWNLSVQTKGHLLRMDVITYQWGFTTRRGCLIAESQERVARAKPLPGDEVGQFVDLTSIVWKSPLEPPTDVPNGEWAFPLQGYG